MGKSLLAWVIGLCAVPHSCAAMWQVVNVSSGLRSVRDSRRHCSTMGAASCC